MILVTVGTGPLRFNRLVEAADSYAGITDELVIIQRGSSTYQPIHADYFDFNQFSEMKQLMSDARVVVMHSAAGSILMGLQMGKSLVLVPRRKEFGELYDGHQLELAEVLLETQQAVVCDPPSETGLAEAIEKSAMQTVGASGSVQLVMNLRNFLAETVKRNKANV